MLRKTHCKPKFKQALNHLTNVDLNFLAHTFLSGDSEEILIGNFIADFIKGNQFEDYSATIVDGIFLHRNIDSYTDQHTVVRDSIHRLRPDYGKYSGVVVDIYYDHFLAINWSKYTHKTLKEHAQWVYQVLQKHQNILPPRVQQILPNVVHYNWLENYAYLENIERALIRVGERAKYNPNIELAIHNLKKDFQAFDQDFQKFFPDLVNHVNYFLSHRRG